MVDRLTTAQIADRITALLPTAATEFSAISKAGATNISFNTDIVKTVSLGGPGLYREGEIKQLSDQGVKNTEVYKAKLVHILLMSNEFDNNPAGEEIKSEQLAQVAASLVKAADVAILNGTDPRTGTARTDLATINLKDNAVETIVAAEDSVPAALVDLLKGTKKNSGLILSGNGFAEVAYAVNTSGAALYPAASKNEVFPFIGGVDTVYSSALGIDGWTSETEVENDNLAVTGPWETVARAFSPVTVTASTEATVGGVNLFAENMTAYRVEQFISFAVTNPAAFSVLKTEA